MSSPSEWAVVKAEDVQDEQMFKLPKDVSDAWAHALDAARAEGVEWAVAICEGVALTRSIVPTPGAEAKRCAIEIRALTPPSAGEEPACGGQRDDEWEAAIRKMPPTRCGRLDMATSLMEVVEVGRVVSDRVKYVYVDGDEDETVVVGQRADEVAYAAACYIQQAAAPSAEEPAQREFEGQVMTRADLCECLHVKGPHKPGDGACPEEPAPCATCGGSGLVKYDHRLSPAEKVQAALSDPRADGQVPCPTCRAQGGDQCGT